MRAAGFLILTALVIGASTAAAAQADPAGRDLGAGPVVLRITPCLIASKTRGHSPCPQPQLRADGSAGERAADHLARARYFIDLEDLKSAAAEINAAIEIDPGLTDTHHLAARLALTMGDYPRAEREIAIAKAQAPDDLDVRATSAAILETRGAVPEAFAELNAIIARKPDHTYARLERAAIHTRYGNPAAALLDLDVLVNQEPDIVQYRSRRALALLSLGQPALALVDIEAALKHKPRDLLLLATRARAYVRAGDDEAALADLDAILGPAGEKPRYAIGGEHYAELLMQRALILARTHRFADAASDMAIAVTYGGRPSILRAQLFLRRNGFPDVALDGNDSTAMRSALAACFGLNACFAAIQRGI